VRHVALGPLMLVSANFGRTVVSGVHRIRSCSYSSTWVAVLVL
jgi:hypothetical protein